MVEPLFRFDGELQLGATVLLDGPEGQHASAVRRMRVGEAIALTNGRGLKARGQVVAVQPKSLSVQVASVEQASEPALKFCLVQAIAKGDRDELAIQAATELGASTVIPWQAQRSISIWANKAERNQARWQQIVDEASKQSLRATFANVLEVSDSKGMRDRIINSEALWLILDPTSTESITQIELPASGEVFLVVGPEGGISESELSEFESAGAKRVHMGQGILRTSTAGLAAIAYLAARTGRWS